MTIQQFIEMPRFNTGIQYGTIGGPEFNTDITVVHSGAESRNANWLDSRGRWEVGTDVMDTTQINGLIAFFRQCRGRATGFRFKDWSDYKTIHPTEEQPDLPATGGFLQIAPGILQMVKLYYVGPNITYRIITKPVEGTITLHGVAGTIDYTKGQIAGTGGVDPLTFNGLTFPTTMAWEGEFDIPARFDVDQFQSSFDAYRDSDGEALFTVSGLTIVELHPDTGV